MAPEAKKSAQDVKVTGAAAKKPSVYLSLSQEVNSGRTRWELRQSRLTIRRIDVNQALRMCEDRQAEAGPFEFALVARDVQLLLKTWSHDVFVSAKSSVK